MSLPIKETQEAMVWVLTLGVAAKNSLADGKPDFGDINEFFPVLMSLNKAIDGAEKIPAEIADIDKAEYDQLVEAAKPYVEELSPDAIEPVIFGSLKIIKDLLSLFGLLK